MVEELGVHAFCGEERASLYDGGAISSVCEDDEGPALESILDVSELESRKSYLRCLSRRGVIA